MHKNDTVRCKGRLCECFVVSSYKHFITCRYIGCVFQEVELQGRKCLFIHFNYF